MEIWKWAKENGIDRGLPYDKIHELIKKEYFSGSNDPRTSKWIDEILSGRKTPFRVIANDAWKKQYNRQQIQLQAKGLAENLSRNEGKLPEARVIQKLWDFPRWLAVQGHAAVFPVSHAGDLLLRPESWKTFAKGFFNTYTKFWDPVATERMMDVMRRQKLFDTGLRSGLDLNEHMSNLAGGKKGAWSDNAWKALIAMRYQLWDNEMQKYIHPGMSEAEQVEIGKNLAAWANHATGSAKGPIASLGGNVLFGPKLTQSKLSRVVSDPLQTYKTFRNWGTATPGERAVAKTRLAGLTQYAFTTLAGLYFNNALNNMTAGKTGKKDQVNFTDPTKSDYMKFKVGGLELGVPGMQSEIHYLAKILAAGFENSKEVKHDARGGTKFDLAKKALIEYAFSKANPIVQVAGEAYSGHETWGKERPLPWSDDKGEPSKPKYTWTEYLLSHGPIPLTGPIRYVYDQMRARGSNAQDAMAIVKGLILYGVEDPKAWAIGLVGATGLHIGEDYGAAKTNAKRNQVQRQLGH